MARPGGASTAMLVRFGPRKRTLASAKAMSQLGQLLPSAYRELAAMHTAAWATKRHGLLARFSVGEDIRSRGWHT